MSLRLSNCVNLIPREVVPNPGIHGYRGTFRGLKGNRNGNDAVVLLKNQREMSAAIVAEPEMFNLPCLAVTSPPL